MSMNNLEQSLQLIRDNEDQADFVGPREDRLIQLAEAALGISFPPTYRRFLQEKGCGSIAGAEFYGLINVDFLNASVPNGIWLTLDERKASKLPLPLLLVSETGDGGYYAIDTSRQDSQGESPVIVWFPGLSKIEGKVEEVAEDFGAFMFQRLTQALA
jgi:antitoxin YobK